MPAVNGSRYGLPRATGQYPGADQVTRFVETFAREAGLSIQMARKRLYDTPRLATLGAAAVRAYRATGNTVELQRFLTTITGVSPAPVLTKELEIKAQSADGLEDLAEKSFDLNQCKETATARVRAIDGDVAYALAVRAGLVAKYRLDI